MGSNPIGGAKKPNMNLLEQARLRYPAGTRYKTAHTKKECTVSNPDKFYMDGGDNMIKESHGDFKKNGHNHTELVYYHGHWAEIISVPKESNYEEYSIY